MLDHRISLNELAMLFHPETVDRAKINCIKAIRSITGAGLKEAKDFFENTVHPVIVLKQHPPFNDGPSKETQKIIQRLDRLEAELRRLTAVDTGKHTATTLFDEGDDS